MTIGASLFLIAVGAILKWAVNDEIEGIDLTTVGLILLIVGVVGLVIGLWQTERFSRRTTVRDDVPPPPDRRY